jgi:hypothetical protein
MIEALCDQLIDYCSQADTRQKIEDTVLDPVICYIGSRLWPYILTTAILLFLLLMLTGCTVYLVVVQPRR